MRLACPTSNFNELSGITTNKAKEFLSLAYVRGIAAQAGLQTNPPTEHDDGIDLEVCATRAIVNGSQRSNPRLFLQLKATSHPELSKNGTITYRFKSLERYRQLASNSTVPQALVVYVMPDLRNRWIISTDDHIDFVGHAFYFNMADAPQLDDGDPPVIVIPLANRLTTHSLITCFEDAVRRHYP